MRDKELNHFESFLDDKNDYEKCLNSFSKNIEKIVRETPGISTLEVYQNQLKRMRACYGMSKEAIRKAFTVALANNLGETIQCLGKSKKIEGKYYQQLQIFEA